MKLFAVVFVLLFSVAACAGSASNQGTNRIWIIDVTIVSPESLDHIVEGNVLIEDGRIVSVERRKGTKKPAGATVVSGKGQFLIPGLIDSHVHLSYGNAKTQEDIDLYASLEFRAIRGLEAAQRVLRAGYTAMADLSISGRVSLAVRDAIEAGLFAGPRVSSSGRALTTRQGLDDW